MEDFGLNIGMLYLGCFIMLCHGIFANIFGGEFKVIAEGNSFNCFDCIILRMTFKHLLIA